MRHHRTTIGEGTGTEFAIEIEYHRTAGEAPTYDTPGEPDSVLVYGITLESMTITTPKSDVVIRRNGFTADALQHIEAALHIIVEGDEALIETLEGIEPHRRDEDDDDDTREERAA